MCHIYTRACNLYLTDNEADNVNQNRDSLIGRVQNLMLLLPDGQHPAVVIVIPLHT
jgi:hypothetical protein